MFLGGLPHIFDVLVDVELAGLDHDLDREIERVEEVLVSVDDAVLLILGFQVEIHAGGLQDGADAAVFEDHHIVPDFADIQEQLGAGRGGSLFLADGALGKVGRIGHVSRG